MPSSKRRKVDGQDDPNSAVSAISALAARRRLAASSDTVVDTPSDKGSFTTSQHNSFDALRSPPNEEQFSLAVKRDPLKIHSHRGLLKSPAKRGPSTEPEDSRTITSYEKQARKSIPYASFTLSEDNYQLNKGGISRLKLHNDRFPILGSFGIRVVTGEVSIYGANLISSEKVHWIHAPICHGIPVIRTGEKSCLEIHPHPQARSLHNLGRYSPLFRRLWNEIVEVEDKSTYKILCTSDDAPKKGFIQQLSIPPEWNKMLAAFSTLAKEGPRSILVCGPKSSGKSTFSRLLCNRILTSAGGTNGVVLLDIDPGQPEFAIAGTLSLVSVKAPNLGASFAHSDPGSADFEVVRSHTIASVTPASCPDLYKECLADLFDTYQRLYRKVPLIVNTAGWILGTGLDLLTNTIGTINPSNVIYMSEGGPMETVESLQAATRRSFSVLPSPQLESAPQTAAQLRAMRTMAYFHRASSGTTSGEASWIKKPLYTVPPMSIRCNGSRRGILGILSYNYQSPPELLAETINGMVLAAVEIENRSAFRGAESGLSVDDPRLTPEGIPYIPNPEDFALDPRHSHFIGLVLVRSIARHSRTIQVLTPISQHKIKSIKDNGHEIVLVHGKFDTPTWAYTEELYEKQKQDSDADNWAGMIGDDVSEDDLETESESVNQLRYGTQVPWVESLKANEKRPAGSRVWRVRRDLGRNKGE